MRAVQLLEGVAVAVEVEEGRGAQVVLESTLQA